MVNSSEVQPAAPRPGALYRGAAVPYITGWSSEEVAQPRVVQRLLAGIGYLNEQPEDRDERGILWRRAPSRPGRGRPMFGDIHTGRQRQAMSELLCQVCAGPSDQTEAGTLWLLKDHRGDWPGWPNGMGVTEPPICLPCAQLSRQVCPALRKGNVALRAAHCPVSGVVGELYKPGALYPTVTSTGRKILLTFEDPVIQWTCAVHLVREITGCTFVDLDAEPLLT